MAYVGKCRAMGHVYPCTHLAYLLWAIRCRRTRAPLVCSFVVLEKRHSVPLPPAGMFLTHGSLFSSSWHAPAYRQLRTQWFWLVRQLAIGKLLGVRARHPRSCAHIVPGVVRYSPLSGHRPIGTCDPPRPTIKGTGHAICAYVPSPGPCTRAPRA